MCHSKLDVNSGEKIAIKIPSTLAICAHTTVPVCAIRNLATYVHDYRDLN